MRDKKFKGDKKKKEKKKQKWNGMVARWIL